MDVCFIVAVIHFYSGMINSFPFKRHAMRKNLYLSVFHCLGPKIRLREMDFLYPHGGLIGYGNSNLDTMAGFSDVFRLDAKLHDAAGAVQAERKLTGLLLCVWTWTQFLFFSGHITGFRYCLYLKIFLLSIFSLFDC